MQVEDSANAVPILFGLIRTEDMRLFREVLRVVHHGDGEIVLFVPLSAWWSKEMRRREVVYGVWWCMVYVCMVVYGVLRQQVVYGVCRGVGVCYVGARMLEACGIVR